MSGLSGVVDVAVGVLSDASGRVLVNQRPQGKSFAGQWEFPGGKIAEGESVPRALARELAEELGIVTRRQRPLISLTHEYDELAVRLHVNEVLAFTGTPRGLEGQALRWIEPESLGGIDLLAANAAIVKAVMLPRLCLVTDAQRFGIGRTLELLARHLERRRVLVVVREKTMERERLASFVESIRELCRPGGSLLCVHLECDFTDYERVDGVHLPGRSSRGDAATADRGLLGISCHSRAEIRSACEIGADYVFLSPVLPTASHPGAEPLGWRRFEELCAEAAVPVYALGGMALSHLEPAIDRGAQGIATLSSAWK